MDYVPGFVDYIERVNNQKSEFAGTDWIKRDRCLHAARCLFYSRCCSTCSSLMTRLLGSVSTPGGLRAANGWHACTLMASPARRNLDVHVRGHVPC